MGKQKYQYLLENLVYNFIKHLSYIGYCSESINRGEVIVFQKKKKTFALIWYPFYGSTLNNVLLVGNIFYFFGRLNVNNFIFNGTNRFAIK